MIGHDGKLCRVGGTGPELSDTTSIQGNDLRSVQKSQGVKSGVKLFEALPDSHNLLQDARFQELAALWLSLSDPGRDDLLKLLRNLTKAQTSGQ